MLGAIVCPLFYEFIQQTDALLIIVQANRLRIFTVAYTLRIIM
jgi:hypothetical protein